MEYMKASQNRSNCARLDDSRLSADAAVYV